MFNIGSQDITSHGWYDLRAGHVWNKEDLHLETRCLAQDYAGNPALTMFQGFGPSYMTVAGASWQTKSLIAYPTWELNCMDSRVQKNVITSYPRKYLLLWPYGPKGTQKKQEESCRAFSDPHGKNQQFSGTDGCLCTIKIYNNYCTY